MYTKNSNIKRNAQKVVLTRWQKAVRKELQDGDQLLIKQVMKCSPALVCMTLSGRRQNNKVWSLAKVIVDNKKELINKLKQVA